MHATTTTVLHAIQPADSGGEFTATSVEFSNVMMRIQKKKKKNRKERERERERKKETGNTEIGAT